MDEVNGHQEEAPAVPAEPAQTEEKGIPNFWLEALQSTRVTSELIQECDEPILAHLQDIRVKLFDQKPYGYTLEFYFSENPFFSNRVLTKTYELKIEIDAKDPFSFEGPDLDKVTGTKIDWLSGKNVTVKLIKKKLKSKNKKVPPKVVTKEEKQDSFFNFFDTPKVETTNGKTANHDHADEDDDDGENNEELMMFADFEIAQQIREKVVPKAVLYFTGDLDDMDDEDDYEDYDEDDEDDEDGEGGHDDEDDEDDDDDDDDDDEDDGGKKSGKHGKKSGKPNIQVNVKGNKGGKGGEPTPSECKQN